MDTGKWKPFDGAFRGVGMRRGLIGQYFTFAGLRITSRVMPTSPWGIPASNPLFSPSLMRYCSGILVIPDPTECAVFDKLYVPSILKNSKENSPSTPTTSSTDTGLHGLQSLRWRPLLSMITMVHLQKPRLVPPGSIGGRNHEGCYSGLIDGRQVLLSYGAG